MAYETIKKEIFTDKITNKQGSIEVIKWTGGETVYHVVLSGDLVVDYTNINFNDSLGVTKEVMEIIRDYDCHKIYVTLNTTEYENIELGQLCHWSMARGETNFYYMCF